MSYPEDPNDLLRRKKTSGYSSEYEQEKVPTPYDPNPEPLPDVRPPKTAGAATTAQQQQQQQAAVPGGNLPAPRQTLTPEQAAARNRAIQQQQIQQQQIQQQQIQQQQIQQQQAAGAAAGVAAVTAQKPAAVQQQQPVQKAPAPAAQKPKPQAKKQPADSVVQIKSEAPKSRPKIDKDKLEFVSGSDLEGKSNRDKLLDTEGLVKIYDGRTVVNGVAINVGKGEIVGLLGPNGAGKTTSFYMIVGLVPPNGGTVMFNGVDVTKMPMYKRARLGMGYLPQEESIFRKLTVEENIMAVMQTMKYSRKEKKAKCEELLERFSITHIRNNIAMACSGGEKRRVTIARSLVPNPSLIMLDEPFAGVDPIAVNEIQGIVEDLRKEGLAILLTDHNARQTLELVDRAYLIYEGKVLREGSQEFLVNDPVSRELYLGERFTM